MQRPQTLSEADDDERFRGRFGRGVAAVASGQAAALAVSVGSLPLLAALYTPSEFAALGVFAGVVAVVGVAGSFSFDRVVPVAPTDRLAAHSVVVSLVFGSVTATVTGLVAWPALSLTGPYADSSALYAAILTIALAASAWQQAFLSWSARHGRFGRLAVVRLGGCLARVATQIALGWGEGDASGLVVGFAAGQVSGATLAAWACRGDRRTILGFRPRVARALVSRYRRFSFHAAPSEAAQRLAVHLPAGLLAVSYGADVSGWYLLAQRLYGAPQTVIQQSVARVMVGVGARSPSEIDALSAFVLRRTLVYAAPAYAALALLAPWLTPFVFGAAWGPTGAYITLLAPAFLARLAGESVRPAADLLGRPGLHTVCAVAVTAGVLLGVAAPWLVGWSATAAVGCLGGSVCAAQLFGLRLVRRAAAGAAAVGVSLARQVSEPEERSVA